MSNKLPLLKKTTIQLPHDVLRDLRVQRAQEDRHMWEIVADAIRLYLRTKKSEEERSR
jgi:hypothetical protein